MSSTRSIDRDSDRLNHGEGALVAHPAAGETLHVASLDAARACGERLRYELIAQPSDLSAAEQRWMAEEWIDVACSACAMDAAKSSDIADAWARMLARPEEQPGRYDRIVNVRDSHGRLVSFASAKRGLVSGAPLIDWSFAMTRPEFRQTRATARSWDLLLAPDYLRQFAHGYLGGRTANPLMYGFVRLMLRRAAGRAGLIATGYPDIGRDGRCRPVPAEIRRIAQQLARNAPHATLDEETLVLKRAYARHGPLYAGHDFRCRDSGVARFFADHVRPAEHDGVQIVYYFRPDRTPSTETRGTFSAS